MLWLWQARECYQLLMEHSGASFVEAVESLATHAGMQIPDQVSIYPKIPDPGRVPSDKIKIDKEVEATSPLAGLYERMEQAAKFYRGSSSNPIRQLRT